MPPLVTARDPLGDPLWGSVLFTGNSYDFAEVRLSSFDGEYQGLVQWIAEPGTWEEGWGSYRQHLWQWDTETGDWDSTAFGPEDHSSIGQLGWSGGRFAAGYASGDAAYIAAPPADRAPGTFIARDPYMSGDLHGTRGAIAWGGARWGLFYTIGGELFFAEAEEDGAPLSGLSALGPSPVTASHGSISAAGLDGAYYLATEDGIIGIAEGGEALCRLQADLQAAPSLAAVGGRLWTLDADGALLVVEDDCTISEVRSGPIPGARLGSAPRLAVAEDGSRAGIVYLDGLSVFVQPLALRSSTSR